VTAQASKLKETLRQRLLAVFIHLRYEVLHRRWQEGLKRIKAKRRSVRTFDGLRPGFHGKKANEYAFEALVDECRNTTTADAIDSQGYREDKQEITDLRWHGKRLVLFNDQLGTEYTNHKVWNLLPARCTPCIFDETVQIEIESYLSLERDGLNLFLLALRALRPEFQGLCYRAAAHDFLVVGEYNGGPRLKLHTLDRHLIANEPLDSPFLLTCFEFYE